MREMFPEVFAKFLNYLSLLEIYNSLKSTLKFDKSWKLKNQVTLS